MNADRSPVSLATQLAKAHPTSMLPCPICAAGVSGAKLGKHLKKVHAEHAPTRGDASWRGDDLRITRPLLAFVIIAALALGIGAEFVPTLAGEVRLLALVGIFLVALPLIGLGLNLMWPFFKSRLSLEGNELVLRYALGLSSHALTLPASVELGSLKRRVGGSHSSAYAARSAGDGSTHDATVGTYLGFSSSGRTLTVGCPKSTGVRKHWNGWRVGRKRRMWDITVAPEDFVALQYQLAARGVLSVAG